MTKRRPWPRVTKRRHTKLLRSALAIATLDQVHVAEMLALSLTLTCRRILRSAKRAVLPIEEHLFNPSMGDKASSNSHHIIILYRFMK